MKGNWHFFFCNLKHVSGPRSLQMRCAKYSNVQVLRIIGWQTREAQLFFFTIEQMKSLMKSEKRIERINETTLFSVLSIIASNSTTIKIENKGLCPYRMIKKECVSILTTYKGTARVRTYVQSSEQWSCLIKKDIQVVIN